MKRSIDYIIADPEGNTTILVLSQVEISDYQAVAKQLLEQEPQAEQVGYIKTDENGDPVSMDMCGLEFCGNATRAFGFYRSLLSDPPATELSLNVSGCDHPLKSWIEPPEKIRGRPAAGLKTRTDTSAAESGSRCLYRLRSNRSRSRSAKNSRH